MYSYIADIFSEEEKPLEPDQCPNCLRKDVEPEETENCSCHIVAPCSQCTTSIFYCPNCDEEWEISA